MDSNKVYKRLSKEEKKIYDSAVKNHEKYKPEIDFLNKTAKDREAI